MVFQKWRRNQANFVHKVICEKRKLFGNWGSFIFNNEMLCYYYFHFCFIYFLIANCEESIALLLLFSFFSIFFSELQLMLKIGFFYFFPITTNKKKRKPTRNTVLVTETLWTEQDEEVQQTNKQTDRHTNKQKTVIISKQTKKTKQNKITAFLCFSWVMYKQTNKYKQWTVFLC